MRVELLRGEYKRHPNNPTRQDGVVHYYCPPEHVAAEMDSLIAMHGRHSTVLPEVEAAWLHHRFTQIHPFQDGNGRVARALATLVFLRAGYFPLVIRDVADDRVRYLDALEAADRRDLRPLVDVFSAAQRKAFVQALGISSQVLRSGRTEQVVAATRQLLEERERAKRREWERVKALAGDLLAVVERRLNAVAGLLREQTGPFLPGAQFFVDSARDQDSRSHYFRLQIIDAARELGYFANFSEYRAWIRLVLKTGAQSELLISFHAAGHEFRGLLAASACFFRREETEVGERQISQAVPLADEIFQMNYLEQVPEVETRLERWLDEIVPKGLDFWRQGL